MKQLKLNAKLFILLTIVYFAVGLFGYIIFKTFAPEHYFRLYYVIVLFYWITGILLNYFMTRKTVNRPGKLLNIYLMGRMIKLFATIIFLFVGVQLLPLPRIPFAISLMANYVLYSMLELYLYYRHNKILQNKNNIASQRAGNEEK